jgi:hypothetical protein
VIALVALSLLPVILISIDLHAKWTLIDEGLVARGVVIGGQAGRNDAGEDYCVEEIAFEDHLGISRQARRHCADRPQIGEKVTVRYSASNPKRAYVDGDTQFGELVFLLGLGVVWFLSKLVWKALEGVGGLLFSPTSRI